MKIYNTLTKKTETLKPLNPPEIKFYACGPTVYDYTHLGHLRRYTMDDLLIRTLRHAGFKVNWVQNVTDVGHLASDADTGEDKLEKGAKKYQSTVWEIAHKFEDYFYNSLDQLNVLRPDRVCRATDYIEQQIAMVKTLEAKGYTYVIDNDGVYFDTSKLDDYGKLARLDVKNLQEGARLDKVVGRKHPADFALWKFERPGENRAMVWESPWAERGFPGWHIECSSISNTELGEQIDIHSGGIDHIPVHHTNEIAQSETASGKKPFVKYWVHHNFLQIDGQKMSKSLGNLFTVDDVTRRGFHPLALRMLFMSAHYRREMNFTWQNLAAAQTGYLKLLNLIIALQQSSLSGQTSQSSQKMVVAELSLAAKKFHQRFFAALEDDLKTPEAVAVMWEVTKANLPATEKLNLLLDFDQVLGLKLDQAQQVKEQIKPARVLTTAQIAALPAAIQSLLDKRHQARQKKDFALADELRDQLVKRGYAVKDTAQGQEVETQ